MKKVIIFIAALMLLAGCSRQEKTPANETGDTGTNTAQEISEAPAAETNSDSVTQEGKSEDYAFKYNDVDIHMNTEAEPVIEALGDYTDYFEAQSCAFQGLDKIYYYGGFEVDTYPNNGVDFISCVDFKDDTVSTPEGIYIGSTLKDVLTAYGKEYTEDKGAYTYVKEDSRLTFIIENDTVTAITYFANVDGLQQN
jgi:hypothetical protein